MWWLLIQGPLYKWTEHFQNFIFWNYKVGGAPIPPRGWMGVSFLTILFYLKVHIKTFLMRGQKSFLSSPELGFLAAQTWASFDEF